MSEPANLLSRPYRIAGVAALTVAAAVIAARTGLHIEPGWAAINGAVESLPRWVVISTIVFLAAIISSTVGFAFSAVASAIILHFVPNGVEAVQIMMAASIGIQTYSVAGLARSIRWTRCAPFILGGIATLPLGTLLLLNLEPRQYMLAMAAALIAYGAYMLVRRPAVVKGSRIAELLIGACSGITGPLAASPGAAVAIWCSMRGWDKVTQRAVYQPHILILQLAGMGSLYLLQNGTTFDFRLFTYALPALAGAVIGLRAFQAMTDVQFQRAVNLAMIASGIALALK